MKTAVELFEELNAQDETTEVEAKGAGPINRSIMETVCTFSNEPDLGGGYILIGADKEQSNLFPSYTAEDIGDTDKLQSDLATQCNGMFNVPVRPRMKVETVNGLNVLVVHVDELPPGQKPLYFRKDGLPQGAYRRIGPTDHRCTEDDMALFYADRETYDRTVLKRTTVDDVDRTAVDLYLSLREKVNPAAEELTYDFEDLLLALGCLDPITRKHLTVTGLLLFGTAAALRREVPMVRADYVRVPGLEWVADPNNRFHTVDMRGPMITLVYRLVDAVFSDLPKGFRLGEGELQAESTGFPVRALREAIVNALMHRSYRVDSPVQVIRYDNRIEIRNPGYSLKSEEQLGTAGSETRNPVIAAVFHDTNLAETKGSGIRAMRRLLEEAHLAPPTFESERVHNIFTARLLLHHFLSEEDLAWLSAFDPFDLNDNQKRGLIMVRELGAIDNSSYRQQSGLDTLTASLELRSMRDASLLEMKGKGSATYYVPGRVLLAVGELDQGVERTALRPVGADGPKHQLRVVKTPATDIKTPAAHLKTPATGVKTPATPSRQVLLHELDEETRSRVLSLKKRQTDPDILIELIRVLCQRRPCSNQELAILLDREEKGLRRTFLKPMVADGKLRYKYPEVISHPNQAYITNGA